MKRSPFVCAVFLAFLLGLAEAEAQGNPPQSASEIPKASVAANQAGAPRSNTAQSGFSGSPASSDESAIKEEAIVPAPEAAGSLVQPPQPKTEILDSSATGSGIGSDGHDPILDAPPLPTGTTTLVGGTVRSVDHIHDRVTIAVFGGNRWKIAYDERTHIFLNGAETTELAIKKGARVYVDTMLDPRKHEVFARNIRVGTPSPSADADGQIVDLDEGRGRVTLRDRINSVPVQFGVDTNTRIVFGNNPVPLHDVKRGSLVHVRFSPEQSNHGLAREIVILAAPGSMFTYVGKITYLDMHRGMLAMDDTLDQKSYDIHFDPAQGQIGNDLAVGAEVRIEAVFDNNRYNARSIVLTRSAKAMTEDQK